MMFQPKRPVVAILASSGSGRSIDFLKRTTFPPHHSLIKIFELHKMTPKQCPIKVFGSNMVQFLVLLFQGLLVSELLAKGGKNILQIHLQN